MAVTSAVKPAAPVTEIGYAQAPNYNWWQYQDETTPELMWPQSISVYDAMRRTDAQVTSVLRAMTLPVRSTPWRIDPNGASDEVTEFVADNLGLPIAGQEPKSPLRQQDRFSWDEHLRQALLMLPYGHMYFEQVYRVDSDGKARLRKLGPRMPKTIEKIDVAEDGGLVSISQYWTTVNRAPRPIPVNRLVAYIHEKEGGNWLGSSILRPGYKNWLLKDRLLRVWAQTIERNGMGVPRYTGAEGEASLATGLALAKAWRSGESAGAAIPFGSMLDLVGVNGTLPDAEPAVRYHDEQLGRAVLAHFLNLGTQTGSWALGTTFADFFTLSLQSLAQQVQQVGSLYIIEDLVDINFGPDEPAPKLVCDEIGSRQPATAQSLVALFGAGALTPDERLEESLRQQYGLPPKQNDVDTGTDLPLLEEPPAPVTATADQAIRERIDVRDTVEPGQFDADMVDAAALVAALADFCGEIWAEADFNPDLHPRGAGGRFRSTFAKIQRALADWGNGDGPDDPLHAFPDREPLRQAAVKRGVKLRRGATREEIVDALLADARGKRTGTEDVPKPRASFTLKGDANRDLDVGVYVEAKPDSKIFLRREKDGRPGTILQSFDDLSALHSWAEEHGETELAGWAARERDGSKPVKKAAKKAPNQLDLDPRLRVTENADLVHAYRALRNSMLHEKDHDLSDSTDDLKDLRDFIQADPRRDRLYDKSIAAIDAELKSRGVPAAKRAPAKKAGPAAKAPTRADTILANDIAGMARAGDERGLPAYLRKQSLVRLQGAGRVLGIDLEGLDRDTAADRLSAHALATKPARIEVGADPIDVLAGRVTAAPSLQGKLDVLANATAPQLRKVADATGIKLPTGLKNRDEIATVIARQLDAFAISDPRGGEGQWRAPAENGSLPAVPPAEQAARDRQVKIDRADAVHSAVSEVEQLLTDGASDRALKARITSRTAGQPDLRQRLLAAVGDEQAMRKVLADLRDEEGLTPIGAAGAGARFDPNLHESIGGDIPLGASVTVVKPGHRFGDVTFPARVEAGDPPDGEITSLAAGLDLTADQGVLDDVASDLAAGRPREDIARDVRERANVLRGAADRRGDSPDSPRALREQARSDALFALARRLEGEPDQPTSVPEVPGPSFPPGQNSWSGHDGIDVTDQEEANYASMSSAEAKALDDRIKNGSAWMAGGSRGTYFGSHPDPDVTVTPERQAEIRAAIEDIAFRAGRKVGAAQYVDMETVREGLAGRYPRVEVDNVVQAMNRTPDWNVAPEANQKALTPRARLAAVVIGNQDKHAIAISRRGPRPVPEVPARPSAPSSPTKATPAAAAGKLDVRQIGGDLDLSLIPAGVLDDVQSLLDGNAGHGLPANSSPAAIGRYLEKWANGPAGPFYHAATHGRYAPGDPGYDEALAIRENKNREGAEWVALAKRIQATRRSGSRPVAEAVASPAKATKRAPAKRAPASGSGRLTDGQLGALDVDELASAVRDGRVSKARALAKLAFLRKGPESTIAIYAGNRPPGQLPDETELNAQRLIDRLDRIAAEIQGDSASPPLPAAFERMLRQGVVPLPGASMFGVPATKKAAPKVATSDTATSLVDAGDDTSAIAAILAPLNSSQLKDLARTYQIRGASKMRRDELVTALTEAVRRSNLASGTGETIAESAQKARGGS